MKKALLLLAFLLFSEVWASENSCSEFSSDFSETAFASCVENSENVSSFFKCLYRENIEKGRTDKEGIPSRLTNIALHQQESVRYLQKEGIITEQHMDKAFEAMLKLNFHVGPKASKVFLFSSRDSNNVKVDDYICYLKALNSIQCDLPGSVFSNPCNEWSKLVQNEIRVHQKLPINCHCLLEEYKGDNQCFQSTLHSRLSSDKWKPAYEQAIIKGVDNFKNLCSEYTVTKQIAETISDSLEEYFWISARNHNLFKAYLTSFPNGKLKEEAESNLKEKFIPAKELVKNINESFEEGESLKLLLIDIEKYQSEYSQEGNDTLNALVQKFNSTIDTVSKLGNEWTDKYKRSTLVEPQCLFATKKNNYSVDLYDLNKLPEKNGTLTCYYPLFHYIERATKDFNEELFAVVHMEANITNKKISSGTEYGFSPLGMEVIYKSKIEKGTAKGQFNVNSLVDVNFNAGDYKVNVYENKWEDLDPKEIQNIFYILGKNEHNVSHLDPYNIVWSEEPFNYKISQKNGKILSVSVENKEQTIFMPLNKYGEINGTVKYWDSSIGNVEITVDANKPRIDDTGKTKVSKVKIMGCTFNPPRKIIRQEKTKWGNRPIFEKYTKQCEAIANETGMSALLEPTYSHTYQYGTFIPDFLTRFLNWNNAK